MNRDDEFDRVLGLIYDSALEPKRLPDAVAGMMAMLDGDTCHLVGWDRCSGLPSLSVMTGLPEILGHEYAAHDGALNPRRNLLATQEPDHMMNCQEHCDDRCVSRSEFFQDYLLPKVGVQFLLAAGDLVEESENLIVIGFQRYVGHGPFSVNESTTLERLLPHLRRSLRLLMTIEKEREEKHIGKAVAEMSNLGVVALSSSRMVLWANRRGEALLRDGVWFRQVQGRLQACDPGRDAALQQAVHDLCADGRPRNLDLRIDATSTARCCLTLMPLHSNNQIVLCPSGAAVLALVATNGGQRIATVQQLMVLFRLTPAEARVARAIAQGDSVDEYASREGVTRATVKTQLQAAFAKTGAGSQTALVRLIMMLPTVRDKQPS